MINPFTHRKILKKGRPGTGTIIAMSNREAGASSQNVAMTLQIRVEGMSPYEVEDQWMVSSKHVLGFGMALPVKVDPDKPQKVAIDWDAAQDQSAAETAARRAALAAEGPVGGVGAAPILDPLGGDSVFGGALGSPQGFQPPAAEPSIDLRNDPELRAKIEKVIGRELTPGTTERLDFASDPQMGAQVMQVIAQHQAELQMRAMNPAATSAPTTSSADDVVSKIERLDALRQSGALSQEEFDSQKRKLLE
ncbi:MAG: SHOCT domain-containing protein [Solirubrobacterales bacterium]